MKNIFDAVKKYALAHKIISTIVILVVIYGGYKIYVSAHTTTGVTRYVLGTVQKGLVISSLSESGQVSTTNQIDVASKVSGNITWVGVKVGDTVYAGQALASIDNTTAKQAVTDAEASLAGAQLQYQQDQASAPINYQNTLTALTTAQDNLATEYNNTFNDLSNTYLDLPTVINGAQNILYGFDLSPSKTQANADVLINTFNNDLQTTVRTSATQAESDYTTARSSYDPALAQYQITQRNSATSTIETLLTTSIQTTTNIAQALQSELNFLALVSDVATQNNIHIPTTITTLQTNARNYLTTTNNDLSLLLSEKKALQSAKQTITTDQQNIVLLQVGNPTQDNPITLQIEKNNLAKQQQDLDNLKTTLGYYTITAPFAGTISAVPAKVGLNAGTIATVVTNQQIAQLSVNEVDAAKIALGDKAVITFDALSDLSITGTINEIDPVGTVSQGVVSYIVKITFDTQDPRVKPGMTVNASIQTAAHPDVLYVPSSAVKTTAGASYVQAFTPPLVDTSNGAGMTSATPPVQTPVTVGISNSTSVEILSGVTEGQQIVTRTTTGTTATKTTTTPTATSLLGGGAGGRPGATGGVRIGG